MRNFRPCHKRQQNQSPGAEEKPNERRAGKGGCRGFSFSEQGALKRRSGEPSDDLPQGLYMP